MELEKIVRKCSSLATRGLFSVVEKNHRSNVDSIINYPGFLATRNQKFEFFKRTNELLTEKTSLSLSSSRRDTIYRVILGLHVNSNGKTRCAPKSRDIERDDFFESMFHVFWNCYTSSKIKLNSQNERTLQNFSFSSFTALV